MRRLSALPAVLLWLLPAAPGLAQKTEVPITDLWKPVDGIYLIHADPQTQVLVFPGGELVLDGAGLDLFAGAVRLEGHTVVRSFSSGERPEPVDGAGRPGRTGRSGKGYADIGKGPLAGMWKDKDGAPGKGGENGGPGKPGRPGLDASRITLRVGEVLGDGRLTIWNGGTAGGDGQRGGPGGHGGDGARGRDAGRSANCKGAESAGDGGEGGRGGFGGAGGDGGRGGNGGAIVYSASMAPAIQSGRISLRAPGGPGGRGGLGGEPGVAGSGGPGGKRSKCGGAGDPGPDGPAGEPGPAGVDGVAGENGSIVVLPRAGS